MLVICNGASKSGSTWLCQLLIRMINPETIPNPYQKSHWKSPTIKQHQLIRFLETQDYSAQNYVSKSHWRADQRINGFFVKDLLDRENIIIFNVYRDIKDVLVSKYHHDLRIEKYVGDFNEWFEEFGLKFAAFLILFHKGWQKGRCQPILLHYKEMVNDLAQAVRKIARSLELNYDENSVAQILKYSDMQRQAGGGNFRKGIIGEWKNYLSEEQLESLAILMNKHGLRDFELELGNITQSSVGLDLEAPNKI